MSQDPKILEGRVALVTGAARRLGRHLALCLAEDGADVVIHYHRHRDDAESLVERIAGLGRRAWCIESDFLVPEGAADLVRRVASLTSRLDLLVNNVGNYLVKPLDETTAADFRGVLEANLVAPQTLIRETLRLFPAEGGSIVNLGYAGVESISPNLEAAAYQVSKTGLYVLTKSWARQLAPRGIRVNMISPGQLENSVDLPEDPEACIPLGRAGTVTDIADALRYLIRPDGYVTGVNIDVAGGYRL